MNWRLRRAGPDDLRPIVAIEQEVFADSAWSAATMLAELRSPHTYYLLATHPDSPETVVGYGGMFVGKGAEQADIQTIAVVPELRSQGLGRELMTALIREAELRGVQDLFLDVRADNIPARALYRSLGFAEQGVRRGYYQPDAMDAVVMALSLLGPAGMDGRR